MKTFLLFLRYVFHGSDSARERDRFFRLLLHFEPSHLLSKEVGGRSQQRCLGLRLKKSEDHYVETMNHQVASSCY
jgi:hypothetical protein